MTQSMADFEAESSSMKESIKEDLINLAKSDIKSAKH